jgi:hypothetical protein
LLGLEATRHDLSRHLAAIALPAHDSTMERDDVEAIFWLLADIRTDLRAVRRMLEDAEEEEDEDHT